VAAGEEEGEQEKEEAEEEGEKERRVKSVHRINVGRVLVFNDPPTKVLREKLSVDSDRVGLKRGGCHVFAVHLQRDGDIARDVGNEGGREDTAAVRRYRRGEHGAGQAVE